MLISYMNLPHLPGRVYSSSCRRTLRSHKSSRIVNFQECVSEVCRSGNAVTSIKGRKCMYYHYYYYTHLSVLRDKGWDCSSRRIKVQLFLLIIGFIIMSAWVNPSSHGSMSWS